MAQFCLLARRLLNIITYWTKSRSIFGPSCVCLSAHVVSVYRPKVHFFNSKSSLDVASAYTASGRPLSPSCSATFWRDPIRRTARRPSFPETDAPNETVRTSWRCTSRRRAAWRPSLPPATLSVAARPGSEMIFRIKLSLHFINSSTFGREPWSSGYGSRLVFYRLWVWIPAPYTGWTFSHLFVVNILVFVEKRGQGWLI